MNFTDEQKAQIRQIREATNRIRATNRDARFRRALAHASLIHAQTTDQTGPINLTAEDYENQTLILTMNRGR